MLSEDVRRVNLSLNGSQHCLAKGAPNRNPEHEHKRSAPNQQDAGNNPAMPTAKFETSKFCHWFRGPDSRNRVPASAHDRPWTPPIKIGTGGKFARSKSRVPPFAVSRREFHQLFETRAGAGSGRSDGGARPGPRRAGDEPPGARRQSHRQAAFAQIEFA